MLQFSSHPKIITFTVCFFVSTEIKKTPEKCLKYIDLGQSNNDDEDEELDAQTIAYSHIFLVNKKKLLIF